MKIDFDPAHREIGSEPVDPDDAPLRAEGPGWQTRVNEAHRMVLG